MNEYIVDQVNGNDGNSGLHTCDAFKTIQHSADIVRPGDVVNIRDGIYNERVLLRSSGFLDMPISFQAFGNERPVIDGTGIPIGAWNEGLFEGRGLSHIKIKGLSLKNSEWVGFLFDEQAEDIIISKCLAEDCISSGIWAWHCNRIIIDECEVRGVCVGPSSQEAITLDGTSNSEVRCCHVHHVFPTGNGGEGIDAKNGCSYVKIHHNRVHDLIKIGIYVDGWDTHSHHIEVYENEVYRIAGSTGMAVANEQGGLVEDVIFRKNICHRNGHSGITIGNWPGSFDHPMKNIMISENTVFLNGRDDNWIGGGINHMNLDAEDVSILDNVVSQNNAFQIALWGPGVTPATVDGNLIDGFRNRQGEVKGTNAIEKDVIKNLMLETAMR